ncbi:flagellar motor switch protein FliG [Sinomonas atrocyanea]
MTGAGVAVALTGMQKAAIVLMQLSTESAVRVMAQFTEAEAEAVAAEIVRLGRVDADVSDQVIAEFHDLVVTGRRPVLGGRALAQGLLQASLGADRAEGVMGRLAASMAGNAFEFLETVDTGHLLTVLDGELPETVALILAHLRPETASLILAGLGQAQAGQVARALATMGPSTPETIGLLADELRSRLGTASQGTRQQAEALGGIQPLVDIINRSDAATEQDVMEGLDALDPVLAEEVRAKMLTFTDLVKFERRDIQRILRGVEGALLAKAMKGAPAPVVKAIHENISDRNRDLVEAESKALGPIRASEVQEARAQVVYQIRVLEAAGEITVRRGDEDFIY